MGEEDSSEEPSLQHHVASVCDSTHAMNVAFSPVGRVLGTLSGNFNDYETALAGTYLRMSLWMESFIRLDDKRHFQALLHGARCLYELLIDLVELQRHPSLAEKFHAFTLVAKYAAAEKRINCLDRYGVPDTPSAANERAFVANSKATYYSLLQKHWPPGKKAPLTWNGTLAQRAGSIGQDEDIEYRSLYSILCWHSHAGLAAIIDLTANTFDEGVAFAHLLAQKFYRRGTDIIGKQFRIYEANPNIKQDIESWMSHLSPRSVATLIHLQR